MILDFGSWSTIALPEQVLGWRRRSDLAVTQPPFQNPKIPFTQETAQRFELSGRGIIRRLLTTLAHRTPSFVNPPAPPVRSSDLLGANYVRP